MVLVTCNIIIHEHINVIAFRYNVSDVEHTSGIKNEYSSACQILYAFIILFITLIVIVLYFNKQYNMVVEEDMENKTTYSL